MQESNQENRALNLNQMYKYFLILYDASTWECKKDVNIEKIMTFEKGSNGQSIVTMEQMEITEKQGRNETNEMMVTRDRTTSEGQTRNRATTMLSHNVTGNLNLN